MSIVPDDDHQAVVIEPTDSVPSAQVTTASSVTSATATRTRGRRHRALTRLRGDIPRSMYLGLGVLGVLGLLGGWTVLAASMGSESFLLPTPAEAWSAGLELYRSGDLMADLSASGRRMAIGYGISIVIGVVVGVLIGSFRSAAAFAEPQIALLRYIPASALTPLFLLWLGIDEAPKIALIVVGTVFYNILMIADVARAAPQELVNASYTLGAGRITILRRVLLPHSWPGIIDVARVNLAAGWLMLVVAELLAAQEGLAFRVVRAQRFRDVETMFALLIVFAAIGLVSDLLLRALRNRTAPWSEGSW
ncbi:MAG: ABC transporter permease [Acidimicrobiales bacterium]